MNRSSNRPVRPLILAALVAATQVPELRGSSEGRASAAPAAQPATSAPIVLAQRCYTVNGQRRCF